jgi:uncharacterized integral membrane protein
MIVRDLLPTWVPLSIMSTPQPHTGSSPSTAPAGASPATTSPPAPVTTPPATSPPATPPPATPPAGKKGTDKQVAPTRAGMVWVSVCVAVLLAIALIIFLAQNTRTVAVHFLGLSGSTSLALMMLIAAVAGALITVIAGSARIIQLRRRAKSH